jgi:hypothetical protein
MPYNYIPRIGLITSGFWIDEFIETTWLAVAY